MYLTSAFKLLITWLLLPTSLQSTLPHKSQPSMAAVKTIYQYPLPTWIENIAATSSGHLLVSFLTSPELHLIDPSADPPTSTLAYSFVGDGSNITGLLGIAELQKDVFAFVAGVVPQTATPGK